MHYMWYKLFVELKIECCDEGTCLRKQDEVTRMLGVSVEGGLVMFSVGGTKGLETCLQNCVPPLNKLYK